MLTILKMNPIGNKSEQPIVYFEFGFDNTIELPKLAFQIGEDISIVANNSIAVNNKTNIVYKFNGDSWIRTNDKYNSSNNSNITTNGNYSIANNSIGGFNGVNVDVEPTGLIEKEITENGTYLPASDEATAYSKVVANIPPHFSEVRAFLPNYNGVEESIVILDSTDGNYILDNNTAPNDYSITRNCLISPASSIKMKTVGIISVTFTPAESFDVNNITLGTQQVTISGDTVTPGDDKLYQLYINGHNGTGSITKYNSNDDYTYWVTINPES